MRLCIFPACLSTLLLLLPLGSAAQAQYSSIAAGRNGIGEGFFESVGVSWGAQFGNNGFFNFGGGAPPPFGGGNDGGGANFGFQGGRPGGPNFRFNLHADQGSSRTLTSNTASVTVPNGGYGSIFSGTVRPFVTGIVPVVGQASPVLQRYHQMMQEGGLKEYAEQQGLRIEDSAASDQGPGLRLGESSAQRGDLSIAEIRRQQAAGDSAQRAELLQLLADADRCIGDGKHGAARVYLQQAARRAEGSERSAILAKLESIK